MHMGCEKGITRRKVIVVHGGRTYLSPPKSTRLDFFSSPNEKAMVR